LQRQYWQFYWPLTLTGLAVLLAKQFQNGALARYPDAVRELAIFAIATSTFFVCNAAILFIPQMANVLARSRRANRVCLRFTVVSCVVLSTFLALLSFSPPGRMLLAAVFDIEGSKLNSVMAYLRLLTPLIVINALRQYYTGLLVQGHRTATVTIMNAVYLASTVAVLVVGFQAGWSVVTTLALSLLAPAALHLVFSFAAYHLGDHRPDRFGEDDLSYREVFAFFWPVAVTSVMFALSRPILYSFVSRRPDSDATIAVLRVAFDFTLIFQNPMNQFRHLFVTFGGQDAHGVRRFMIRVMMAITAVMLLVAATPISTSVLRDLLGVGDELLARAGEVVWVMCLIPLVVTARNYYHGLSLVRRRTRSMAAGGIGRVLAIYAAAWALYHLGWLNHAWAAVVLVLGFVIETAVVVLSMHLWPHEVAGGDEPVLVAPDP